MVCKEVVPNTGKGTYKERPGAKILELADTAILPGAAVNGDYWER